MNKYMIIQRKRIEIDKWLKGCEIKCDPGTDFVFNWIEIKAESFRRNYERSLCKNCQSSLKCGYELRRDCDDYSEYP